MSQAQFTIPLITVIPGQLITAVLWNNEWTNVGTNLNPLGIGGYEDTDAQMQIQTAPYPSSVTSHATSLGGELERIRYQISAMLGATTPPYWYAAPPTNLTALSNITVPLGGSFLYPSATPPSANFLVKNGQAIGRVAYAALFSLIGTTFGIGDGSTTFNLPNSTDKMPIGAGNLYALAGTGGAVSNTPTISITDPGHNHTQNSHTHTDSGHVHTGPSHTHTFSFTNQAGTSNMTNGNIIQSGSKVVPSAGGTLGTRATLDTTTQAEGTENTGTGNASISTVTPTNNSNTTGITAGSSSVPTLPPYLAEYWMIRVL